MVKPYTGFDKIGRGITPGLKVLQNWVLFTGNGQLTNLGAFGVRDMRGSENVGRTSVHATGRAMDIGWNKREVVEGTMFWLLYNAEQLGVEMLADYWPRPFGRTWRCDRWEWKVYDKKTIHGAPGGRWIHVEISPEMASSSAKMEAAIRKTMP